MSLFYPFLPPALPPVVFDINAQTTLVLPEIQHKISQFVVKNARYLYAGCLVFDFKLNKSLILTSHKK